MPPQHGKSELTTRNFPAYLLGKNPNRKVVISTYNATKAKSFNRDVQRVIDTPEYHSVFPETTLSNLNVVTNTDAYLRNSEIFEIVGKRGSLKAVGRGGALTGDPVDIGIIDDPIKDRAEAVSPVIREKLWEWYIDVFCTRLHNQSQQLIILTRWHEDDLAGRLLAMEPDEWEIIKLEAIKESQNEYDPRELGEALWPEKHSKERILKIKKNTPVTFDSLYQQDPKIPEGIGIFWNRSVIEQNRVWDLPRFKRVVIGEDPAGTEEGDEFGIVGAGLGYDGKAYVFEDSSGNYSPSEWGKLTAALVKKHDVDCIAAEQNQGGEMIREIIRIHDKNIRVKLIHAHKSKATRAEPVFAQYEEGNVKHVGKLQILENQMVTFNPDKNPKSPNRVDALVHCLTELLGIKTGERKGIKRRN